MAPDAEVGASQGEGGEGFNNEDWDAPGAPSDLGSLSAQTQWMDQQGGMSRNVLSPRSRPSLRPRPCLGARQVGSPSRRRRCRGSVLCLLACGRAWLGIVWGARHRGISVPWDIMASAGAAGPLRDASTACCRSATVPEAICVSGRAGCDAERLLRRGAQESGISMMNEMSASNQPVVVDDANIIDVWAHNMEAAFKEISEIVQTVPPPFTPPAQTALHLFSAMRIALVSVCAPGLTPLWLACSTLTLPWTRSSRGWSHGPTARSDRTQTTSTKRSRRALAPPAHPAALRSRCARGEWEGAAGLRTALLAADPCNHLPNKIDAPSRAGRRAHGAMDP
jgi:hypothetical protein